MVSSVSSLINLRDNGATEVASCPAQEASLSCTSSHMHPATVHIKVQAKPRSMQLAYAE